MANAINTGSTISYPDGTNKTSTSLSTHILILVNGRAVGAVQSISVNESRNIKMIDEIGTDGHIDSAPTSSTNITGSCNRVRFDRLRISEAFGRGFIHVSSQMYPFDIVLLDRQKQNAANQVSTVIKNVWIKSIDTDYSATDWIVTDKMNWEAEAIYSVLSAGGNKPVAAGGEIGIDYYNNIIERQTDTGLRRGSMDASGLIDLGGALDGFSNNGPF
jgi:hypothetical protein